MHPGQGSHENTSIIKRAARKEKPELAGSLQNPGQQFYGTKVTERTHKQVSETYFLNQTVILNVEE